MSLWNKYHQLVKIIKDMKTIVVAFSGGVDSTLLAKVVHDVLDDKAMAVTITSPFHPTWEIKEAEDLAKQIGIQHVLISKDLENEALKRNPVNRCYICKKDVFGTIKDYAEKNGYQYVVDGSNYDDTFDYRPGMKALKELSIRSPLLEAGLTKKEIRRISKELKLPTWDKPPYACLLTRIPYGREITMDILVQIEKAETFLIELGFRQVRVRVHDQLARIELGRDELKKVFEADYMEKIYHQLKNIGFQYVTLDLQGYTMGSFNPQREE